MSEQPTIRPASNDDHGAIGRIAEAAELFPASALGEMIVGYRDGTSQDIWFVAECAGRVLSFGFCEPERATEGTWNLLAIGVDPAFQGQGIGTLMMRYIEDQLTGKGQRILLVETMGTPEFVSQRRFYGARGYTEEARIREFYEPGGDKVVFWKHL
ncbi:MAG: GNAT family N-acetyltransferase [Pseudomonadota bacterium]